MTQISKKNFYEALINFAETGNMTISADDMKEFASHEIELIDNRAAKAKETRAKKAAEPDKFIDAIIAALTDEYQTAADIVVAIGNEELTAAKATYRLNALVEDGVAIKDDIKFEGQRSTRKAYKRA